MNSKNDSKKRTANIINFEEAVLTKQTTKEIKSVQDDLFQYEGDEYLNWKEAVETVLGTKLPQMDLIYKKKSEIMNDVLNMLPNEDIENVETDEETSEELSSDILSPKDTLSNIIDLVSYRKTHMLKKMKQNLPLCEQILLWGNNQSLTDIDISLLLADVRRGFEAGELIYLYQPQWDLKTGQIVALESFLHWKHPTKGVLGPDYLIQVFEKSGLLPDLTILLFEQLVQEVIKYRKIGMKIPISFGVVPEQMEIEGLSGDLLSVIYDKNLSASDFECVFYNTKPSQKPQIIHQNIQELQTDGFRLCLNNFGTGYTAYPYIQSFIFDKIKFDKNYLNDMLSHPRAQLIVQSFIQQAHLFGSYAVADGINSKQVIDTLRLWNCDYGQGSYLNAPVSSNEMVDFLKEYVNIKDKGINAVEDFWHTYACSLHSNGYGCEHLKQKDK